MEDEKGIKELVLARLDTMPDNIKISIGNEGELDKKDLIAHVKKGDPLGKQIMRMHVEYIKALTKGI